MNYKITFEEMSKKGKKILENQKPVTLEKAKEQVKWLRENSKVKEEEKKK